METTSDYSQGYRQGVAMAENYSDRIAPGWVIDQAEAGKSTEWLQGFHEGWEQRERELEDDDSMIYDDDGDPWIRM